MIATTLMTPTMSCQLDDAKCAFTTRRVNRRHVKWLSEDVSDASVGDLILCEIIEIGHHKKIQLANGRASVSYVGDKVVLALGDRYAPDQFEGAAELGDEGDLLASGGVVGQMRFAHERMKAPTRLRIHGVLRNAKGQAINVADYALKPASIPEETIVIGVFGASMNAGKTTAAVCLAHGLKKAGWRVAGVKATGTGAFGDFNAFLDAGVPAADFTDAGMPTTYKMGMDRIEQGFETLVGAAAADGAEIVIVEIADGVFQQETAAILAGSRIIERMDTLMFAAPDALGAVGGIRVLEAHDLRPFAISGMVTRSPLAAEEARCATGVRLLSREELCDPESVSCALADTLKSAPVATPIAA